MEQIELISPLKLDIKELVFRKNQMENVLKLKMDCLENVPDGTLKVSRSNNSVQFYIKNKKQKKYLHKNEKLIQQLAQKTYDEEIITKLKQEIKYYENIIEHFKKDEIASVYDKLHEVRKELVTPVISPKQKYAQFWQAADYEPKHFTEDTKYILTDKNEKVRSKSEALIANKLHLHEIPYHYEYPIQLKTTESPKKVEFSTFHPDFYCLNVRTRQEFIWEHFGMLGDIEYDETIAKKMTLYAQNGWILGKNFIATFETSNTPLDIKTVEQYITNYLE